MTQSPRLKLPSPFPESESFQLGVPLSLACNHYGDSPLRCASDSCVTHPIQKLFHRPCKAVILVSALSHVLDCAKPNQAASISRSLYAESYKKRGCEAARNSHRNESTDKINRELKGLLRWPGPHRPSMSVCRIRMHG